MEKRTIVVHPLFPGHETSISTLGVVAPPGQLVRTAHLLVDSVSNLLPSQGEPVGEPLRLQVADTCRPLGSDELSVYEVESPAGEVTVTASMQPFLTALVHHDQPPLAGVADSAFVDVAGPPAMRVTASRTTAQRSRELDRLTGVTMVCIPRGSVETQTVSVSDN